MHVSAEAQQHEPPDLQQRVLKVAGNLVAKHPDLEFFVDQSARYEVSSITEEVRAQTGVDGSLAHLVEKGVPMMLLGALNYDHPSTGKHSAQVMAIAVKIARVMGMDESDLAIIREAAKIHDVGKLDGQIRPLVDVKGDLTGQQKDIVGWHPVISAKVAECFGVGEEIVRTILDHHHRDDGEGYMQSSPGIDPRAAVVNLADALSVMYYGRPQQGRLRRPFPKLIEIVESGKGEQFDPDVAAAFLQNPEAILRRRD